MDADSKFRRIFIDTEFTNFVDMSLISIGLVDDRSNEFYAELDTFPISECNEFVRETVLPHLGLIPEAQMSRNILRDELHDWLVKVKGDKELVVLSYDHFCDYVLFVEALGVVPGWVRADNIKDRIDESKREEFWKSSGIPPHHALSDARALRFAYRSS
jgi:hypothetical protein